MTEHLREARPSWRASNAAGKIAIMQSVFEPGMSAKQIADAVSRATCEAVTRQAVIGMFGRHEKRIGKTMWLQKRASDPKRKTYRKARAPAVKPTSTPHAGNIRRKAKARPHDPIADVPTPRDGVIGPGLPMDRLAADQCRYAVNDAPIGVKHLLCGRAVHERGASWCAHHAKVVTNAD